jgi:uncharacterized membrane protein
VGAGELLAGLRPFLTRADKARIVAAIEEAERHTSGEIHVHVVAQVPAKHILEFAEARFAALGLHRTEARNGVLILVAHLDRRFAIFGDEGLHSKAGQKLWERAREAMGRNFVRGRYVEGIEACVLEVGVELARHFPAAQVPNDGRNELSNEVSEG